MHYFRYKAVPFSRPPAAAAAPRSVLRVLCCSHYRGLYFPPKVQLKNYKMENEALRSGQSASLAAVKQNADTALQNLLTVITNSQSSIK